VPERRYVSEVESYLNDHGVAAASIGPDWPRKPDVVHVGTLHRFKGLEYQRMIVAGASNGVPPPRGSRGCGAAIPCAISGRSSSARCRSSQPPVHGTH
jgi:superfamily I DNA/RNA helicase